MGRRMPVSKALRQLAIGAGVGLAVVVAAGLALALVVRLNDEGNEVSPAVAAQSGPPPNAAIERGGARRVGEMPGPGPAGDPKELWTFPIDSLVRTSPAVSNGVVYVGGGEVGNSADANLYAIDTATGAERWRFAASEDVAASPVVVAGVVYFSDRTGTLYALDAATGAERWQREAGGWRSSPAVLDGILYSAGNDDNVYALDAASGREVWRYAADYELSTSPAVADGVVYVAAREEPVLYAIDAATGKERWRIETLADGIYDATLAVSGGVVYVPTTDGILQAVDAEDGSELWRFDLESHFVRTPAVVDGVVYVSGWGEVGKPGLHALDAGSGDRRWRFETGGDSTSGAAVVDGVVYVGDWIDGSDQGAMFAVDAESGEERWRLPIGSHNWDMTPAVVDGVVYAASFSDGVDFTGALFAIAGTEPVADLPEVARATGEAGVGVPPTFPPAAETPTRPAAQPAPRPGGALGAPGVVGTSYTSPTYGYSMAWDAPWTVFTQESAGGDDVVFLTNGTSQVFLTGSPRYGTEGVGCRDAWRTGLGQGEALAVATGADGGPLEGGDAAVAFGLYEAPASADAPPLAIYVECRALSGGATVTFVHSAPQDVFEGERQAVLAIYDSLRLPAATSAGNASATPGAAPPPAVQGEAVAAASPVTSVCDALAEFRANSMGRIEQALAAGARVSGSTRSRDWEPAVDTVRALAAAQRGATVPLGAEAAQEAAVEYLDESASDMSAFASAMRALEVGDYLNSVPDVGPENIYALADRAEAELAALPERCDAAPPSGGGSGGGLVLRPDGQPYTCPPDQATIAQNRATADNSRSLASGLPVGSSKGSLLAQADYADQLADDWIAACGG